MYSGYHDAAILLDDFNNEHDMSIIDKNLLPPEFMPYFDVPTNPWSTESAIIKDFIVIAEFSELEGPKPLITIPKDANGTFDLNSFVLKIMSVDHQSVSNEKFSVPEDTQVVLSEDKQGVYAYVHHFTLHDSQARGFVRPFCMAYVTPEQRKIMTFYEEMQAQFMKVSWNFKYGNLKLFHKDLELYQADLQYTACKLEARENIPYLVVSKYVGKDSDELAGCSLAQVQLILNEITGLINSVEKLLTDSTLDEKFHAIEEKNRKKYSTQQDHFHDSGSMDELITDQKKEVSHQMGRRKSASSLNEDDSVMLSMEANIESYQPKFIRTDSRRFDQTLRTLHELSLWGAKEGVTKLRTIHKYFSRDTAVLEIESRDSDLLEPPSCLLTIGHCVAVNFLHNVDLDGANRQWCINKDQSCSFKPVSTNSLLKRWLSTDTLESFKSAESFFSLNDNSSSIFQPAYNLGTAYVEENSRVDDSSFEVIATPSDGSLDIFHEASSSFDDEDTKMVDDKGLTTMAVSTESEPLSSSESSPKKVRVPVVCAAYHVCSLNETSIGYGILKFVQTHSFSSFAIATVLTGRPLIIIGRSDQDVRATVTALRIFMPGHSSNHQTAVMMAQKPLRITDLIRLKIIGLVTADMNRKRTHDHLHLVPDSIRRYVSILDLEKGTLQAPEYNGVFINTIVSKRKFFHSENSYVAYIESVLLELASKAFIYYHSSVIGQDAEALDSVFTGGQTYERSRELSLPNLLVIKKTIGIHSGDWPIIQYFNEVIKQQQTEEYYAKEFGLIDRPVSPFGLNYVQCTVYKS